MNSGRSLPVAVEPQRVEQVHAETGALDGLQEARGDHLVGVDVLHRHRRSDGGQCGELSMLFPYPSWRFR